jgi:hypothetical protein
LDFGTVPTVCVFCLFFFFILLVKMSSKSRSSYKFFHTEKNIFSSVNNFFLSDKHWSYPYTKKIFIMIWFNNYNILVMLITKVMVIQCFIDFLYIFPLHTIISIITVFWYV